MPFTRDLEGNLTPLGSHAGRGVLPSVDALRALMDENPTARTASQILIVGSGNDIAWVRAALPENLANHINAEIKYPLVPDWFKTASNMGLTQAIGNLLQH